MFTYLRSFSVWLDLENDISSPLVKAYYYLGKVESHCPYVANKVKQLS